MTAWSFVPFSYFFSANIFFFYEMPKNIIKLKVKQLLGEIILQFIFFYGLKLTVHHRQNECTVPWKTYCTCTNPDRCKCQGLPALSLQDKKLCIVNSAAISQLWMLYVANVIEEKLEEKKNKWLSDLNAHAVTEKCVVCILELQS